MEYIYYYYGGDRVQEINGNKTVYDLIQTHPELKEVLVGLGFTPLNDAKMLNTLGRIMTLNRGAQQIKLSQEDLKAGLAAANFELAE